VVPTLPAPRPWVGGGRAGGSGTAAAASLERIGLRVSQQLDALVADLRWKGERHLGNAVNPIQPVDDRGTELAHDAALIDPPSRVELVLRPEQAAAPLGPGELGTHLAGRAGARGPA